MTALINNPEALKWRADMLTLKTRSALQGNFADKNTIVIPWSGGRDSSSILANSFAFFPDKKFKLLTVINGMSENILNPAIQYKRILAKYDNPDKPINVEHYYIDTVDDIKKAVKHYKIEEIFIASDIEEECDECHDITGSEKIDSTKYNTYCFASHNFLEISEYARVTQADVEMVITVKKGMN